MLILSFYDIHNNLISMWFLQEVVCFLKKVGPKLCTRWPILTNALVYSSRRDTFLSSLMENYWGGGANPIFAHGKMCVFPFFPMGKKVYGKRGKWLLFPLFPYTFFPIFPHGEEWGKKYMEREGNEYFSLSFHILFSPFFPMGEKWENTYFSMGKNGVGPPPQLFVKCNTNSIARITVNYSARNQCYNSNWRLKLGIIISKQNDTWLGRSFNSVMYPSS